MQRPEMQSPTWRDHPKRPRLRNRPSGRPKQFSIPAELVEHILLGPTDDRRVLQDSPLLGDVWTAYALDPGNVQDVLITPHRTATAASVASIIPEGLALRAAERARETNPTPASRDKERPKVAYLQGLVGARLYFDEVLCILVPLTQWWNRRKVAGRIVEVGAEHGKARETAAGGTPRKQGVAQPGAENFTSLERYIALAGLIYWVSKLERPADCRRPQPSPDSRKTSAAAAAAAVEIRGSFREVPTVRSGDRRGHSCRLSGRGGERQATDGAGARRQGRRYRCRCRRLHLPDLVEPCRHTGNRPLRSGRKGRCRAAICSR